MIRMCGGRGGAEVHGVFMTFIDGPVSVSRT